MTRRNRRTFIKAAVAAGITIPIAGCSGDNDADATTSTPMGGDTDDSDDTADRDDLGPGDDGWIPQNEKEYEEWREYASERAAEEIAEHGNLVFAGGTRDANYRAQSHETAEGLYEPLNGNIEFLIADPGDHAPRYALELQAGDPTTYDLWNHTVGELYADGIPFMDITDVPGWIQAPDAVKWAPVRGALNRSARGLCYNPELVSEEEAPETWEDLLDDKWSDRKIVVDYDPGTFPQHGIEMLGEDYLRQLAEHDLILSDISIDCARLVAQGEAHVGFLPISNHVWTWQAEGEPIAPVLNPEVWFWRQSPIAGSANSNKPWATKLWIDYVMRPEQAWLQSIRPGSIDLHGNVGNPEDMLDYYRGPEWETSQDPHAEYSHGLSTSLASDLWNGIFGP